MILRPKNKLSYYLLMGLLGGLLTLGMGQFPSFYSTVAAQGILRPEDVSAMVYQKYPEIPLENQYIRKETGEIDPEHTLISRMVRYHRDIQKRIMRSRFDWKLSFADYLGANESIKPERYPGHDTLTQNPLENDIQAIETLNRRQRQEIIDLLAAIYDAENKESMVNSSENSQSESSATPEAYSPTEEPAQPPLSQPGDAQLLMP